MKKKLLAAAGIPVAGLIGVPVASVLANPAGAATVQPACTAQVHDQVTIGRSGHITDWITCGGGHYTFRAEAECFKNGGGGSGTYRFGSWRTSDNTNSVAGCLSGTYINNGGYQLSGSSHYYVLWRYTGIPLTK